MRSAKPTRKTIFWASVYMAVSLAPLVIAMAVTDMPRRGFWTEFSVALGFLGLTMMCLQFFLTARFKAVQAPYGVDLIFSFHRYISMVGCAFIVAHPVILFITQPDTRALLNPISAPLRAQMGWLAVIAVLLIIVLSVFRQQLGQKYEAWKVIHQVLAIVAVGAAFFHVLGVGYYLSESWKIYFWGAMFIATLFMLVYIRIIRPWILVRTPYEISMVKEERGQALTITFMPVGHQGMRFKAGQFVWLTVNDTPFNIEEHPFSISSSELDTDSLAITVKELGDFTEQMKNLQPGTRAYLEGPYGVFTIDRATDTTGLVFIAGGVGITPVMSMLRTMADKQDQRPAMLIYAGKSLDELIFREDLEHLATRMHLSLDFVLEEPPEDWEGETGFVTAEVLGRLVPADKCSRNYYVCGPPPMMDAIEQALLAEDVPLGQIESEKFNLV